MATSSMVTEIRDARCKRVTAGVMSREEANSFFNSAAERYLGISGEEFLRRWDAGNFKGPEFDTGATMVAMLIPMVRPTVARKKSR
jgi:hypothetical protein